MSGISTLSNNIRSLLIELFKTTLDIAYAHASGGLRSEDVKDLKGYNLDNLRSLISETNLSVYTFVSFFEDYIKAMKEALDFLRELLKILGVKNIGEVVLRKVDLRSIVKPSEIDKGLLKFQLKTALEYSLPILLEFSYSTHEKSQKLLDSAKYIESEVIQNFKTSIENLKNEAKKFVKELYSTSEIIFNEEDPSKCVDLLIQITEGALDLSLEVWQTTKFTPLYTKDWIEYNIYEIAETAEKFSEIKRKIEIMTKCREKIYEHEINYFTVILRTLWGSNEIVIEELRKNMMMLLQWNIQAVDVSELVPPKIPVKDLSFALVLARGEFNLSKNAGKRVRENIEAVRLAGEWLKSPVMCRLYENMIKRLDAREKFDEKILEILLELQELTEKEEAKRNNIQTVGE